MKFRPRTEAELRERLTRKKFPPQEVETLLADFRQKGWLDDAKFARLLVAQSVLSKPVGRRMLVSKLRRKGIHPETAEAAVRAGTAGEDEMENARRLAADRVGRMKGVERAAVERRLFGFLSRRGFSADIVYKVVRETVHPSTSSP